MSLLGAIWIFIICPQWLLFLMASSLRGWLVYRFRMQVLRTDFRAYLALPSREEMMRKFWIWNMEEFTVEDHIHE